MIAVIAGEEAAATGPVHIALQYGGFEIRDAASPEDAALIVRDHGDANCVLTIDARRLSASPGRNTWAAFLADHPALSAVVTSHTPVDDTARKATGAANRLLLENPFDAAAVVAGVRRTVQEPASGEDKRMTPVRRPKQDARRLRGSRPSTAG